MKIERYRNELGDFFCYFPEETQKPTLVNKARTEICQLIRCYLEDGDHFLREGDRVNALASFAYAAGWIDAGFFVGLFEQKSPCRILLEEEDLGQVLSGHLQEKTIRYGRLLKSACEACRPSAEPGISWYEGGLRVIAVAQAHLQGGRWFLGDDRFNNALCCFSYGHGWLDAALRVGLISITSGRELFAI
ncbi:MAG TPA: DUF357 domain-containing protein [Methanoregulaceae archaeon]|nr:DUF357 domain-containing protein [Methanoregulaceae archaeon]